MNIVNNIAINRIAKASTDTITKQEYSNELNKTQQIIEANYYLLHNYQNIGIDTDTIINTIIAQKKALQQLFANLNNKLKQVETKEHEVATTSSPKYIETKEILLIEEWWNTLSKQWQDAFLFNIDFMPKLNNSIHSYDAEISPIDNYSKIVGKPYNQLSSINIANVIEKLQLLKVLYLNKQNISDLTPLLNLPELTDLHLQENQITDLTPLSNHTELTDLHLQHNQITDLTPLSNLAELTDLHLGRNQIIDITPLSNLTKLTDLHLGRNQIIDITPLSNLTKLTDLHLGENKISNLTPLSNVNIHEKEPLLFTKSVPTKVKKISYYSYNF